MRWVEVVRDALVGAWNWLVLAAPLWLWVWLMWIGLAFLAGMLIGECFR